MYSWSPARQIRPFLASYAHPAFPRAVIPWPGPFFRVQFSAAASPSLSAVLFQLRPAPRPCLRRHRLRPVSPWPARHRRHRLRLAPSAPSARFPWREWGGVGRELRRRNVTRGKISSFFGRFFGSVGSLSGRGPSLAAFRRSVPGVGRCDQEKTAAAL